MPTTVTFNMGIDNFITKGKGYEVFLHSFDQGLETEQFRFMDDNGEECIFENLRGVESELFSLEL